MHIVRCTNYENKNTEINIKTLICFRGKITDTHPKTKQRKKIPRFVAISVAKNFLEAVVGHDLD